MRANCRDPSCRLASQGGAWRVGEAYEALVFGQQHGDAGINLADGERDEHGEE